MRSRVIVVASCPVRDGIASVANTVVLVVLLRGFPFGGKLLPFFAANICQPLVGLGLVEACLLHNIFSVAGPRVVLGCGAFVVRRRRSVFMRGGVCRVA